MEEICYTLLQPHVALVNAQGYSILLFQSIPPPQKKNMTEPSIMIIDLSLGPPIQNRNNKIKLKQGSKKLT